MQSSHITSIQYPLQSILVACCKSLAPFSVPPGTGWRLDTDPLPYQPSGTIHLQTDALKVRVVESTCVSPERIIYPEMVSFKKLLAAFKMVLQDGINSFNNSIVILN